MGAFISYIQSLIRKDKSNNKSNNKSKNQYPYPDIRTQENKSRNTKIEKQQKKEINKQKIRKDKIGKKQQKIEKKDFKNNANRIKLIAEIRIRTRIYHTKTKEQNLV